EILDSEEIKQILKNGKYAVISMCRGNEPYLVTLSYGYDAEQEVLYFHCSKRGLKIDFIKLNPIVCATVIEDGGYVANECGHHYRTAVFWGKMEIVQSTDEKRYGMKVILNHLEHDREIIRAKSEKSEGFYPTMEVLRLTITQIHGKQGR
ncbi:MAG: pyridoxamine 5'-phosphate oxidase family protein, partial [Bacteroidota bacterium]|nr:pyridoxamine 5'-phosphate oxidase family protein [Bacteroidota bacterium]